MVKKKPKWYTIVSPKVFGGKEVGETVSDDPKKVIGRTISVNAKELTGDFKKSHIVIKLEIDKLAEDKAHTRIKGYEVSRSYVQRFVRKGMSLIKIIQELKTSDNHKVRVDLMATSNGKIQTTKKALIRKKLKEELDKIMSGMTLDNNVFISTTNKIQKRIVQKLKKTHPLRFVEIKKIKLIDPGVTNTK
jgi:small subunit ribosomal protein S3Ae